MEEKITIRIEGPVTGPLKAEVKQQFLDQISQDLSRYDVRNVECTDLHYVDRRSADALQGIVVIIQAIAPVLSIAASALNLAKSIRQTNKKNTIIVTREDGSSVKLADGMTEKEVNDKLNIGRNEEEGSKTEN